MSLDACLVRLQAEGVIDAERAERFRTEYDRLAAAYRKTMGAAEAIDLASRDTMDALERQAFQQRRQTMLQVTVQRDLLSRLAAHVEEGGKPQHFATAVMESRDAVFGAALGVENRRGALYRLAWSRTNGFLSRYRPDALGRIRNGEEAENVVRELRGQSTGDANAAEMAVAVTDTFEWLRQLFNRAGGDIGKLKNWGLPQTHDALEIGKAGLDAWRDYIKPLLAPADMIDRTTGKPFASEEALDEALTAAWRNITSEGMDGQVPGAFTGQGKLANRRSDHRFLIFKDADAWLDYNRRFGTGNVFDAVAGHIDSMTRDIAAMQALGPNPALTVRWLGDLMQQDALPTGASGKRLPLQQDARSATRQLADMWDYYTGTLTAVPPEYRGTARFFSGIRNWNVGSKLGSAFLSALASDPVFAGMTRRFNGLPVVKHLSDYAALMATAGGKNAAEHAGLIFSDMIQRTEQLRRNGSGLNIHELTRRGADLTMRASLLTPHTVAMKQSLGLGFMKDWGEHVDVAFDQLDAPKRTALERYGIGGREWDMLRSVGVHEQGGHRLLRPGDLARRGDTDAIEAATRFFGLIDAETRFGTPGESLRAQTMVATLVNSARIQRGTIGGELLFSATQFKTYSVIMITTQLERALYGRGGIGRVKYALALPTLLTLSGLLATWMHDIFSGKDPSPINKDITWYRAFVRGGGLGVVGDLLSQGFAGERSTAGPVTGFFTGPTLGALADPLVSLTLGNIGEAAQGDETHFGAEALRQLRAAVPGNNIWYLRAAFNRLWADDLQEQIDPNYRDSWRRMEKRAEEQGTQFFWSPGDTLPDRAPDLSNALGSDTQLEAVP